MKINKLIIIICKIIMKKLFNKIKLKIINNNNKNYLKHRQIISKILSLLNFHSKNYQIIAKVMN